MSKLNIYDTRWLDIVFEGRNKEYGAYQLRAENPKTTIKALFSGIFLLGSAIAIPIVLNSTHKKDDVAICNLPLTVNISRSKTERTAKRSGCTKAGNRNSGRKTN